MLRRALLRTAALGLLAGCAGGDDPGTGSPDDGSDGDHQSASSPAETTTYEHTMAGTPTTETPNTVVPPQDTVSGPVRTDGFTAECLSGTVDPEASTVAVTGEIRNETGETQIPTAVQYEFFDDGGSSLARAEKEFFVEAEVLANDTVSLDQTVEVEEADVTEIARMELDIETRP
ncbi:MAG: hypothetical protein V5A43_05430 [Haloarculaceae archaeon]